MAHYYSSAGYYEKENRDDRVLMTCSKEVVSRVMADVQDYHGLCLSLGTAELSCVVQRICGGNSPSVVSYDD